MEHPAGESDDGALRLDFDRRLKLEFHGSPDHLRCRIAGLSRTRRRARSERHGRRRARRCPHAARTVATLLVGLLRQSVFGRLAGYEDVNDAERLRHDPAMRWIVGGKAAQGRAASPSQMGRFETQWLDGDDEPLGARRSVRPMDRPRAWPPSAARHRARHGFERQPDPWRAGEAASGTATSTAPATTRCSCSTSSAIWNAARCVPATSTAPTAGRTCWSRSWPAIGARSRASTSAPTPPSPIPEVYEYPGSRGRSSTRSGCRPTASCRRGSAIC